MALSSNAEAARRIQNEWHSAAIASEIAANIYNLEIMHSNIEDNPENTTRFLVIGREKCHKVVMIKLHYWFLHMTVPVHC